jgi:hypothetical protein
MCVCVCVVDPVAEYVLRLLVVVVVSPAAIIFFSVDPVLLVPVRDWRQNDALQERCRLVQSCGGNGGN